MDVWSNLKEPGTLQKKRQRPNSKSIIWNMNSVHVGSDNPHKSTQGPFSMLCPHSQSLGNPSANFVLSLTCFLKKSSRGHQLHSCYSSTDIKYVWSILMSNVWVSYPISKLEKRATKLNGIVAARPMWLFKKKKKLIHISLLN